MPYPAFFSSGIELPSKFYFQLPYVAPTDIPPIDYINYFNPTKFREKKSKQQFYAL